MESGVDPLQAIEEGFAPGMQIVGKGFEEGNYFLPDMMLAADAMKAGVAVLEQAMTATETSGASKPKVVLATIQGDVHEIGKNILRIILSTSGFEVVDLGRDVKVATIIERAMAEKADIIGVSALMTTTMMYMKDADRGTRRGGRSQGLQGHGRRRTRSRRTGRGRSAPTATARTPSPRSR